MMCIPVPQLVTSLHLSVQLERVIASSAMQCVQPVPAHAQYVVGLVSCARLLNAVPEAGLRWIPEDHG